MPVTPHLQLPLFEGPLEMLLDLVERRRLPITALSLAEVADQYLSQVRAMETLSPELLSDFILIGGRLIWIKARALLPQIEPPAPTEPEQEVDLVERLRVYAEFRDAAITFATMVEEGNQAFRRGRGAFSTSALPLPTLRPVDVNVLVRALLALIARGESTVPKPAAALPGSIVSVAERLAALRALLAHRRMVRWEEVAGSSVTEIVATLLAVLEMIRRSEIRVEQGALFDHIILHALERSTDTPDDAVALAEAELSQDDAIVLGDR
jgi:segregation and condensation protein A